VSHQPGGLTHQQILQKISAYRAAHGATHHADHGTRERQGLSALFGLAAGENLQGKTGQRRSTAIFLPAQERQHKKEAAIAHGVRGGRRDHQGSPVLLALFDKSQGKTEQGGSAADFFLPAKERQYKKRPLVPMV
jgi:hypothetical protein